MRPAIFLDRDGVINQNRSDYVKSWAEFRFLPRTLKALKQLAAGPKPVIIITNQSAVGRGIVTLDRLTQIHDQMIQAITTAGGRIDALYVCPHHPDVGCHCRKPAPGLLLQAAVDLELDLRSSVFVGDSLSDVMAARATGAQPIFLRSGQDWARMGEPERQKLTKECLVADDLAAAVTIIEDRDRKQEGRSREGEARSLGEEKVRRDSINADQAGGEEGPP